MERSILWFKCAAMHDPVRPVIKKPAILGWEAKLRNVDLEIERSFKGEELLRHMKGWFTADVYSVIEIIKQHGRLVTLDDYGLVVETQDMAEMDSMTVKLKEAFQEEVWMEHLSRKKLE